MPLSAPDNDFSRLITLLLTVAGSAGTVLGFLLRKIEGVRKENSAAIISSTERTETSIRELREADSRMLASMVRRDELNALGDEMRAQGQETRSAMDRLASRIDTVLERIIK